MKLSFRNAALPFGERIKTTFISGDTERASSIYAFITGPAAEIERTNDNADPNGVWSINFDGSAKINFERGVYHFRSATVIQRGTSYEMFVTVLFRDTPTGERLIYTIKEL
ncbi:hypothetical protein [Pantoea sp. UBA6567]|uniref:hypothetical protein n=1 Tax=Pantoea sp. UBA6567 TaxID=1947043 RepID=UPI00259671D1|nr:hypothetical protein [Pantoea sp. UBA6567]